MKLSTRLQLFGALMPALLLAVAFALLGLVLDHLLLAEMDRALLGQAAVESVSLFDRLAHAPHLHLDRSPMTAEAREMSASGALYGPDGQLRVQVPASVSVPRELRPGPVGAPPVLQTVGLERELVVAIASPEGQPFALRLVVPMARHHATMRNYWQAAGAVALAVTMLLLTVQMRHAGVLARRIGALARHMDRLRTGDFQDMPPPDPERDVLGELRDAIADATAQLKAARESQERLIADAAHELRTPLAAMRTDIDLALRRERQAEELRETLRRTRGEVDRLAALSQSLLDLAAVRQTAWDRPEGEVVALVDEALQAHRALAEHVGVRLARAGVEVLHARFQPGPLRQVLDNLLGNALRFAPVGSQVTVAIEAHGPLWRLVVSDAGPGVAEPQREAVFAPFHRRDKTGTGAGLGLAIVRDVAQRHGGRAFVEAQNPPPGARFVVELPLDGD